MRNALNPQPPSPGERARPRWRWLLGVLGLVLAWHALAGIAWAGVWDLLSRLGLLAVASLIGINLLLLPLMTGRWWLLLKALGAPVGWSTLSAYRVAVNAINYLTPGPHLGGEPFSVLLLHHRHGIPLTPAATSVALDRLLELLASMVVLNLCLIQLAAAGAAAVSGKTGLALAGGLLALIVAMLVALLTGRRPLSRLAIPFKRLDAGPARWLPSYIRPLADTVAQGEAMAEALFHQHRARFLLVNSFSFGHWLGVFAEFWWMSLLLGLPLSFWQLTAVVLVARLAFLTPLPAGIGALESALPWVTAAVGQGSALGVGLCIIIRLRDLLFSLAGLGLTMRYLACCRKAARGDDWAARTRP